MKKPHKKQEKWRSALSEIVLIQGIITSLATIAKYIYIFFLSLEKLPSQYNPIQSLPVEHLTAITVIFLKYLCALIGLSTEDSNRPSMAVTWVT